MSTQSLVLFKGLHSQTPTNWENENFPIPCVQNVKIKEKLRKKSPVQ